MILLLTSFIAGILTVLAPCTIALLPVIVGGTLAGGKSTRRAITVTLSLGVSVLLFTFLLKVSTTLVNVPQQFWEILSGVIIGGIGLSMLFPKLWERLTFFNKLNLASNRTLGKGYKNQNFWGDVLVGASLGPVFSSCSPTYFLIIATILPKSLASGAVDLLAYTVGLCGMLLVVSVAGQKLMSGAYVASDPYGWFRRSIGALFLILGIAIAFGLEQRFELAFANSGVLNVSGVEKGLLQKVASSTSSISSRVASEAAKGQSGDLSSDQKGIPAPEITKPSGFVNTGGKAITFAQYKGKDVVLVDFWDYSCINCQREIPYVEAWWKKYQNAGLVVVGVHTPEFAFEHLQSNVEAAAKSLGITYPIVLDNDYATWDAFGNQYWPQVYLIDADGNVVYSHSGEGNYAETEAAIQKALKRRDTELGSTQAVPTGTVTPGGTQEVDNSALGSPETYFGSDRNSYLANGNKGAAGKQTLTFPQDISGNSLYLSGTWNFTPQYAETSDTSAAVQYKFDAKNVYFVATGNPSAKVKILLDGQPVGANAGADVAADGTATIDADRLYKLVSLPAYGVHTIEIQVESGTLDAYTFTFG